MIEMRFLQERANAAVNDGDTFMINTGQPVLQYREVFQPEMHFPNHIQYEVATPWKTVPTVYEPASATLGQTLPPKTGA